MYTVHRSHRDRLVKKGVCQPTQKPPAPRLFSNSAVVMAVERGAWSGAALERERSREKELKTPVYLRGPLYKLSCLRGCRGCCDKYKRILFFL